MLDITQIRIPSVFEWIFNAPTLIGKISRVFQTAQTKNWTTTTAAIILVGAHLAGMFGITIDEPTLRTIEAAAIGIIGFFTGVQVVNPKKLDAEWELMKESAKEMQQ